jgi:hypothetical protein
MLSLHLLYNYSKLRGHLDDTYSSTLIPFQTEVFSCKEGSFYTKSKKLRIHHITT